MKTSIKHLLGTGVIALAVGIGSSAQAASLYVEPQTSSVTAGSAIAIDFTIADLIELSSPSLGDYDFNISFNSNVLNYSSITWGSGLDLQGLGSIRDIDTRQAGSGLLNLFEVSLDDVDALQPANFTLFTLTFNAIAAGTSPVAVHVNALGDGLGNALTLDNVGSAQVNVNAVPIPAALPLFLSGLLAIAGLKRRAA